MAGTQVGSTTPRAPINRSRMARLRWSFILFLVLGLLAVSSEIYILEGLRQTWFFSLKPISVMRGLVLLSVATSVLGQTPVDSFYPPTLNDTSYINNSSIGTHGGIYEAPTNGPTGGNPYGTYDYCSMPHPRSEEYQLPEALANGSTKGKLVYLEYLQRHQRRTPYNILPGGENQAYHCDNVRPYLYAGPNSANGIQPMPITPQITIGGVEDGYQHGKDLWSVYGKKLGLIPKKPNNRVWFRSSESALTQASAGTVLRGMWPHHKEALPLHQMVSSVNTVNAGYSCPAVGSILSSIKSSTQWKEHLAVTEELRSKLGVMLGATDNSWQNTFDHFSDNFQGRLCNGYRLPCSLSNPSACVTMQMAEEVFRAGDWEWNCYWRSNPEVVKYIQVVEGLFIGEIISRLQAVLDGNSSLDYSHIFIHDGDIGPILGSLGIEALRWPGMASNVAFEVWETGDKKHGKSFYARVLYSGHPVRSIHGLLDWVPLSKLIDIMRPYVPEDIISLCG
ncbi:Histidine phosphatase superfamily clade-2 [Penicillium coprophilum]|uniref:Histidine phosphatase superfamily clade-2 n=1 Tax=Penicillium coprophilum TaxID=36646 RepID=UPI002382B566|nr:Histidine phosphatase superfamily clade-2 [Penicillium coprophilum]KAJ5158716.1 Histidine phosphatase superfamily clade-2 [Penicillium coprophilum]